MFDLVGSSGSRRRNRNKLGGSITSPTQHSRKLHSFRKRERDLLKDWSQLPSLFEEWDFNKDGAIDRDELLFGVRAFCRKYKVSYSEAVGQQLMEAADSNHDGKFDIAELREFLSLFARSVHVSVFDVIYFMQDLLDDREDWEVEKEETLLVPDLMGALHSTDGKSDKDMKQIDNAASTATLGSIGALGFGDGSGDNDNHGNNDDKTWVKAIHGGMTKAISNTYIRFMSGLDEEAEAAEYAAQS